MPTNITLRTPAGQIVLGNGYDVYELTNITDLSDDSTRYFFYVNVRRNMLRGSSTSEEIWYVRYWVPLNRILLVNQKRVVSLEDESPGEPDTG